MTNERSTEWSAKVESVYRSQGRELWALFYAHCCDAERAYDALQEAFLRLQEQNGTPIRDVRAWLVRVGRNWLADVARRKSSSTLSSPHLDQLAGRQAEPSSLVAASELQSRVREALSRLREDDREILVLRYALAWPSQRIAEVLNLTVSAVDMRLSRARQRLAEILEQAGVNHEEL
jgi:RNA polymerase sigma-70 factor (ECF subfamily)